MTAQSAQNEPWDFDDASKFFWPDPIKEAIDGARSGTVIVATPYQWRDPSIIPPRQWVYGKLWQRENLGLVIAPGATGKTAFLVMSALALATGRSLMGQTVWDGRKRVWLWNLEDSGDELARLIQAAALHHGLHKGQIEGNLFVDSGLDGAEIRLATTVGHNSARILKPIVEALVAELLNRKIDVLMIDPFVSSHSVNENDNGAIDMVAKAWAQVAKRANCVIILAHHTPKLQGMEVTGEKSRGAVSLVNAARSAITLNRMTKDEATRFGIEPQEAARYVRMYDDKHNRAPAASRSDWFHLKSVALGNGGLGGLAPGDEVQVVVPWQPPTECAGPTDDELCRIQDAIDAGEWKENSQAREWAGNAIAVVMGWSVEISTDKARAKMLLSQLIKSGTLRVERRPDANRAVRPYVITGRRPTPAPPPETGVVQGGAVVE